MQASLEVKFGKQRAGDKDPPAEELAKTVNTIGMRVHEAQKNGSPVEEVEVLDMLVNLDITPGQRADKDALQKAQEWAGIEEKEDISEAMRSDVAEDLTDALAGKLLDVDLSDSEQENEVDGRTGAGSAEPPPYSELAKYFGPLESNAAGCGMAEASHFLQKAKMAMIEAHACKPTRQADVREFI